MDRSCDLSVEVAVPGVGLGETWRVTQALGL